MMGEYDAGYENCIDSMVRQMEDMQFRIDSLHRENAKLRELVSFIMHQCNDGNPRCDECIGWNDGECVALLRMRELGVEVDA